MIRYIGKVCCKYLSEQIISGSAPWHCPEGIGNLFKMFWGTDQYQGENTILKLYGVNGVNRKVKAVIVEERNQPERNQPEQLRMQECRLSWIVEEISRTRTTWTGRQQWMLQQQLKLLCWVEKTLQLVCSSVAEGNLALAVIEQGWKCLATKIQVLPQPYAYADLWEYQQLWLVMSMLGELGVLWKESHNKTHQ